MPRFTGADVGRPAVGGWADPCCGTVFLLVEHPAGYQYLGPLLKDAPACVEEISMMNLPIFCIAP
ncbi:hypothetical protein X748_27890 [Mesorhizobium sp. LNJC386A00]|nr:hypothetical protein X748_27890 [Mesorhizobium sp. LNJC386A00]